MTLASVRKATAPAILAIVAVIVSWIVTGTLDLAELRLAIAGLVTAAAVFLVPNDPPGAIHGG